MEEETNLSHPEVKDSALETKSKYDQPWIVEYIVDEKNRGSTFQEITEGLKARGETSITPNEVSRLFKTAHFRTVTTRTEAKEEFMNFTEELREIYGDIIKLMGKYVKILRNINDELEKIKVTDEEGNVNVLQTQIAIAKQIPLATGLMKEVREYVKTQISLFDVVQTTKEKSMTSADVLQQTNNYLPIMIKENIGEIREELGNQFTIEQLEKYLKKKVM